MEQNRRPNASSIRHAVTLAVTLVIGTLTGASTVKAQDPPFVIPQPMCYAAPSPESDTWPRAVTDALGSTAGPFTFPGTSLTANDSASVTVFSVGPASTSGGTVTGTGPYTYTPAPGFVGTDVIPYEIADATMRTTMGLAKITVTASSTSTVPDVVGSPQAAAVSSIGGAGLTSTVTVANSTSAAIGTVVSQNPSGGNIVATGSNVALVVSRGALVPNLVGSPQASAAAAITAAGLTVGAAAGANSGAPVNNIISQSLTAGTNVAPGTAMSYVYSLGLGLVAVPPVVNQAQADATTAITGAGFVLGTVTTASSATIANGNVISQDPAGGAMRAPGTAVNLVVSSGAVVLPPPPPPPAAGGLVMAFGFEEASGTAVTDSSAAPVNGTISGATRVAAGKIGRALSFDGVNDWVTVTDTTASKIDLTNGLTVEAWVRPTSMSGWETVVMKERGAAGTGLLSYALYAHDGAPQAGMFAGPAAYLRMAPALTTTDQGVREASHTALPLNAWTHIATTYDGANMRFYINGVLVATRAQTGNIAVGNQALRIGGNNMSGEFFNGLIDEVRIYNRALSAAEITADMTTPVVP